MKTPAIFLPALLALVTSACAGGATQPPNLPAVAPVAAPAPIASASPDRSVAPAPPSLLAVARIARPEASWRDLGQWSSGRLSLDTPFGRFRGLVDPKAPIDFALTFRLRALRMSVEPEWFASAAVRSERGVIELAERDGLAVVEVAPGVYRLGDRESPACMLGPTAVEGVSRLVCSEFMPDAATVAYLGRTFPKEDLGDADVVVELRGGQLADTLAELPAVRGLALSEASKRARYSLPQASAALQPVLPAMVDAAFDLARGTEKVRVELRNMDASLIEAKASFWPRGDGAWVWQALAAERSLAAPAPDAFWRLRPVADAIWFSSRFDEDHYRVLRTGLVDLFSTIIADTPSAKETADLVVRNLLPHGPVLHAHGDTTEAPDPEHGNPYVRARAVSFFGWHMVSVRSPAAEVERDLAAGMDAYNDGRLNVLVHRAVPQLCPGLPPITRHKAPAAWPKSATLFEMQFTPQFFEQCGARWSAPASSPAARPLVITVALVPDGDSSWIGVAADDKRLLSVMELALSRPKTSVALAPIFEPLSREKVAAGGFFTRDAMDRTAAHVSGWRWSPAGTGAPPRSESPAVWWWSPPSEAGAPASWAVRMHRDDVMPWVNMLAYSRRYPSW